MRSDELAFFNQQLAVMLQEGIPLEAGMRELAAGMRQGPLKTELELLQADLARGIPAGEALNRRQLPEFYRRMFAVGASAQDLPAMLTLLADYYHRNHATWLRLKGLMVYPVIVITVAFVLSATLGVFFHKFLSFDGSGFIVPRQNTASAIAMSLWVSPVLLGLLMIAAFAMYSIGSIRNRLRWRLPAFHEASLAQFAASMALMLRNAVPLPDALKLAEQIEADTPAAPLIGEWRRQIEAGQGKPADWQARGKSVPRLFLWILRSAGDDLATGFANAAEIYKGRAAYKTEMLLYGLLPVTVLLLGQMVLWQMFPAMHYLTWVMNSISSLE